MWRSDAPLVRAPTPAATEAATRLELLGLDDTGAAAGEPVPLNRAPATGTFGIVPLGDELVVAWIAGRNFMLRGRSNDVYGKLSIARVRPTR